MRKLKHILFSQQFDKKLLKQLFSIADEMKHKTKKGKYFPILKGKLMATLFYEPSTRTRFSFESAMRRLGGQIITTENAREFSSAAKGETLQDSIRIISKYCDVIVLRHFQEGSTFLASKYSSVPIINAGDGQGQHPTQALLDIYTIYKKFGRIDHLKIAAVGDLYHGRTIRSLCYLLGKYKNTQIYFVSPENCRMKDDIKEYLDRHSVKWMEYGDLNEVLPSVDCVYMTRIQKERMSQKNYNKAKGKYIINKNNIGLMKPDSIIMHPLPRIDEISPEVDFDKRAFYFKQAENGLYIRMALLKVLLHKDNFLERIFK
jgi:aspartate carbamoyltransferase catalytic subunit